jgi:lysophospholipase L1-like esterase
MATEKPTRRAIGIGRAQAERVLKFRARALRRRAAVLAKKQRARKAPAAPPFEAKLLKAVGGPSSAGVLLAEGDSWFDYPWTDILRVLEDDYGYDVESVAHRGDRVEEMAYAGGQLEEFARRIEKLLRQSVIPKAILLSGGGNDIAGNEFGMLLNHSLSGIAGLNEQVVAGVIDQRIRFAYTTILSAVTTVCQHYTNQRIPIIVHGYDYPVPDGRGFLGGWWFLPGPWLEPGFREKGFEQLQDRIDLVRKLIDRFNRMLHDVVGLPDFSHVKHIDLRKTLSTGPDYKTLWANELHPTTKGFELVTAKFAAAIAQAQK